MGVRSPAAAPNHIRETSRELLPPGTVSMEISGRGGNHHTGRTVGEITETGETGTVMKGSVMEKFTRLAADTPSTSAGKGKAVEGGENTVTQTKAKASRM